VLETSEGLGADARRHLLLLREAGMAAHLLLEDAVTFLTLKLKHSYRIGLGSHFHLGPTGGFEDVIPVRVGGGEPPLLAKT
jgi:hypothetical protein